jgi:hypothetical protein
METLLAVILEKVGEAPRPPWLERLYVMAARDQIAQHAA